MSAWTDSALRLATRVTFSARGPVTLLGVNGWPASALPSVSYGGPVSKAYLMLPDSASARAGEARGLRAVAGSDLEVKVADHAFSVAMVCPEYRSPSPTLVSPYQWATAYLYRHLLEHGVALMVLPHDALDQPAYPLARAILARFEVVRVGLLRRERGYPAQPVALVLRARPKVVQPTLPEARHLATELSDLSNLSVFGQTAIDVPAALSIDVSPFHTLRVDPDDALAAVAASTLLADVLRSAAITGEAMPPLPLRLGHVALQLATGRLDGALGSGEHRHVVKGRVVRRTVTETEQAEDGETIVSHESLAVEITALGLDGRVHAYASAEEGGSGR